MTHNELEQWANSLDSDNPYNIFEYLLGLNMRFFLTLSILCFSPISIAMDSEFFIEKMSINQRIECINLKRGNDTCQQIYNESQNLKLKLLNMKDSCHDKVQEDMCTESYESLENYFKKDSVINGDSEIIEYITESVADQFLQGGDITAYDESEYSAFFSGVFITKLQAKRSNYKVELNKAISESELTLEDEGDYLSAEVNYYHQQLANLNVIEKLLPLYIDALCNPSFGNGFRKRTEYHSCQLKIVKNEIEEINKKL